MPERMKMDMSENAPADCNLEKYLSRCAMNE